MSLPNPPEHFMLELKRLFMNFIWNGKPNKVKKNTLYKPYDEEELNMFNVDHFIKALKISWLKRMFMQAQHSKWSRLTLSEYPVL